MQKIVILGTGGNCIDILDTLFDINDRRGEQVYECVGFLDDNPARQGLAFGGVKVLGALDLAGQLTDCRFVFGIGSTANHWRRSEIFARLGLGDERFETVVHPTASVSRFAVLGAGTIVFQNVTITSFARVGRHVYILPNSVVSHDDMIGDFTCIAGGVAVAGNVRVGRGCYLGSNATLKDGIQVGDACLIGMGSTVLHDVPENSVVVGNPARFLRHTRPGA